jgi:hypothetical protein
LFWRTVGRLILIPIAFLLGAGVAAAIVVSLGLEHVTRAMHGAEPGEETIVRGFDLVQQLGALTSGLSIIPALAVVLIGEVGRIRSWLYYMIGGGLALACVPFLARISHNEALVMPPATVWQVLATAGFAGGLVYWLIAGRSA